MIVNIDTVKFAVRVRKQKLNRGTQAKLCSPEGVVVAEYENRVKLAGSSAYNLVVRSQTKNDETWLIIEGSLAAYFLGQNIVTSADLRTLCIKALGVVVRRFELDVSSEESAEFLMGEKIFLERVDFNVAFPNTTRVTERLLYQIKLSMVEQAGSRLFDANYVRWRKGSLAKELVWYDKAQELRYSKKFDEKRKAELVRKCEGWLRFEVRYRKAHLRGKRLRALSAWTENTPIQLMRQELAELAFTIRMPDQADMQRLSPAVRRTFAHYLDGGNMGSILDKSTFYRHRKEIQITCGRDIKVPFVQQDVSLNEYLTPERALQEVPTWLVEAGLHKELKLKIRPELTKLLELNEGEE